MSTQLFENISKVVEQPQQAHAVTTAASSPLEVILTVCMGVGALIGAVLCYATINTVADATTLVFFVTTAAVTSAAVGAAAGLSFGGLWHVLVKGGLDDRE
jgi:hypothetical protein